MAFVKRVKHSVSFKDPEALFRDLRSRTVEGLLSQQADMLRAYMEHQDKPDIALELPTGSGKTLVGLLIAEWRRRNSNERALFLCPTRQLVLQVASQAKEKYGIDVISFVGSRRDYSANDKSQFQNAEKIGVATYSALFNSNSFFDDVNVIIFDDAHAAENYVSKCWSIEISKYDSPELFRTVRDLIRGDISENDRSRFDKEDDSPIDSQWVNKLPFPIFQSKVESLIGIFDAFSEADGVQYRWPMLRDGLRSCNLYYSTNTIVIRPIAPPTAFYGPFKKPKQRIYMSATLGAGCDLERIFNRANILRIPSPKGWEKQGIGRKFFVFPHRIWDEDQANRKSVEWIKKFGRATILVPSVREANTFKEIGEKILNEDGFRYFNGQEIENNKSEFVSSDKAFMTLANRYDGIDFNGAECRYLIVHGLPQTTNLQEQFLLSRLNLNILYQDRIRTRVTQAVGRCTRSATDFAMVVVLGEKLTGYFSQQDKRKYLHPELQAEVNFGILQSDRDFSTDLEENINHFIKQSTEWFGANDDIMAYRDEIEVNEFPGAEVLAEIANDEVKFHSSYWCGHFDTAFEIAQKIIPRLTLDEHRGYRAWWLYLSGNAAMLSESYKERAIGFYRDASAAQPMLPWLRDLPTLIKSDEQIPMDNVPKSLLSALENLSLKIRKYGNSEHKLQIYTREIRENIVEKDAKKFELAQVKLGLLLGFTAGNDEYDGAPDPWWIFADQKGIVFEDYTNLEEGCQGIPKNKLQQAKGHPTTLNSKFSDIIFTPIFCSRIQKFKDSARAHAEGMFFISQNDMIDFSEKAINVISKLWRSYSEENSDVWYSSAIQAYRENKLDPQNILNGLKARDASNFEQMQ